ncbi:uncharacterized protein LOC144996413 isoform X2 [Oryzias latipes]
MSLCSQVTKSQKDSGGLPAKCFFLLSFLCRCHVVTDTNITCLIMETCILPCSFQRGDNPIVHWIKDNEGTPFLSYYNANPQFRNVKGRGFLFSDQVSKGNASLRLSWVQLHDQGRYTCYVTTRKNERYTYVNVNVQAAPVLDSSEGISREREPVRSTEPTTASRTLNAAITPRWSTQPFPNKGGYHGPTTENVDADRDRTAATPERDDGATKEAEAAPVLEVRMEEVDDTVVCCSKGIYPKPELTWSTEPPSGGALNATTAVWRTSLLLYDIRSSLLLSHEDAVMVYSCVVTSGKHSKKATLMVEGRLRKVLTIYVLIPVGVAALAICLALGIWSMLGRTRRCAPA